MIPDFDDTIARPPRPREPIVDLGLDFDDTVTVQRPVSGSVDIAEIAATGDIAEFVDGTTVPQAPLASPPAPGAPPPLVEPPAVPPPIPGSAIPEVSANVWSEPLPEKSLPFQILLDDGTLVPLDQPVYLGRKPSVPRIHPGGIPLLVTVDSPLREVSSTHLELTTIGGAVVASDLKSTNGSIVRVPGAAPHTLLGGESVVVTPGTVIELGDGNSIEVLAPDHALPDGHPPNKRTENDPHRRRRH